MCIHPRAESTYDAANSIPDPPLLAIRHKGPLSPLPPFARRNGHPRPPRPSRPIPITAPWPLRALNDRGRGRPVRFCIVISKLVEGSCRLHVCHFMISCFATSQVAPKLTAAGRNMNRKPCPHNPHVASFLSLFSFVSPVPSIRLSRLSERDSTAADFLSRHPRCRKELALRRASIFQNQRGRKSKPFALQFVLFPV